MPVRTLHALVFFSVIFVGFSRREPRTPSAVSPFVRCESCTLSSISASMNRVTVGGFQCGIICRPHCAPFDPQNSPSQGYTPRGLRVQSWVYFRVRSKKTSWSAFFFPSPLARFPASLVPHQTSLFGSHDRVASQPSPAKDLLGLFIRILL